MTTGYIGLGNMGGALARRLMAAGPLQVFDLNPDAVGAFAHDGATPMPSLAALAAGCDTILLCLPRSETVRQVIFGADGILQGARPGSLIIDQTTGTPEMTRTMARELAAHGVTLCDAPVSGGPNGAAAGTIAMMVGATEADYPRVHAAIAPISPNIFHAGDVGAGQVIKLANNLLHHAQRLLSLEVMALAVRNGIAPARAVDIILAGSGRNYFLQHNMHPRILAGEMQSGFTLGLLLKDVGLATAMGRDSKVPMPIANLVQELYAMHLGELGGAAQVNTVAGLIDRNSGTRIVASSAPPEHHNTGETVG